ncbi:FCP1 domain-containing protein [Citrus sinensis]|uniref:FCP1 domain-containing protein n=1 Tax=Citrus sinensis TaxID=2711 RepID=A0ACB8K6G8_CITSI|nr:FCP1 domain-containing protein [Citrus sinensis]
MEKLNQLKTIPANELHEDVRLPKMVQKNNNMSTLSLPDEKYTAEKVISSEADETQDATLTFSYREDNLSRISLSSQFSAPISRLRKKLLVLDLNGLLADIVSPPPKDCKADKKIARHAVFKRPFCHDFLRFCFERFDVGKKCGKSGRLLDGRYEAQVAFLLGSSCESPPLMNIQDLSYCTATSFKALENKYKALVFKELRKVWEISDPNCPWAKGDYNESNTVLLDDSPYKALLNPPYTAIFPCSYKYQNPSDNSLGAGGDVRVYLEMLAEAENVQRVRGLDRIQLAENNVELKQYGVSILGMAIP